MKRNTLVWIILVILIAGTGWYLGTLKKDKVSGELPAGAVLVKGFNYGYSPADIVVKEGETVRIRLSSDDSPHTFTIDELGVDQQFTWDEDVDISFVANRKGKFRYYCAVPGHSESGMVGTLIVE